MLTLQGQANSHTMMRHELGDVLDVLFDCDDKNT